MNNLIVLGSGTALPDAERENSGYVWQSEAGLVLLDCGGSPYRRMLKYGLDPRQLRAIFISHNHPDHLMGLPSLLLHLWLAQHNGELLVFGNQRTIATAEAVIQAADLGIHAIVPSFQTVADAGGTIELPFDLGASFTSAATYHSRPTLALRIDQPGKRSLVYGADSGPCETLVGLSQGAHTLIHECTVSTPFETHSTPEQAATAAQSAGVQRLILTHYSPINTAPEAEVLARVAKIFQGEVLIAHDGAVFALSEA
ncbi:MBL fold metallo-hydrolase [Herpetosiphon giganteus]|uniref:MBL fold metallo-hydrolase n=1 Tax=Herpetosiphon giganteus TaxID=2029754 RepID=UPI0019576B03|nr:ribonuclease Z [Herpetosiphon giganteus]